MSVSAEGMQDDPIVGMDLGTTNSLVAYADESGPRVLMDGDLEIVPSFLRYGPDGLEAIGQEARARAVEYPLATVHSVKRLMGRSFEERQKEAGLFGYQVVPGPRGLAAVEIGGEVRTPQEISADLLRELASLASRALGREVRRAVVTVPAYFDDAQRQATRDAGRLAGLDVVRVVNEPTAAALAYGIGAREGREIERIVVYDLGGGTFDATVMEVHPAGDEDVDEESLFRVLATIGDTRLGGDDLDHAIINLLLKELSERAGTEVSPGPSVRQSLRTLAERTRIELSESSSVTIRIEAGGSMGDFERVLTREELEELARPFIDRSIELCATALRDAGMSPEKIDRVVLVGGTTRMPLVRESVEAFFGSPAYTALDPDRLVALGAAVQASIMAGGRRDMLLMDVIPLGLGIETVGGAVAKLLTRNSTIPARATEMFSTSVDGQVNVALHVLQGEREMVADCRSLARFELRGIPPMPAGIPQVEVEFVIDANGVLRVNAVERRSGCRAEVQVLPSFGLTAEEVDRMEEESFEHAREDMAVHRVVDLAVNAALDVKWIGEAMDRVRGELPAAVVEAVEAASATVVAFIEKSRVDPRSVDPEAFHQAKDGLDRASVPVHELSIARSLREDAAGD